MQNPEEKNAKMSLSEMQNYFSGIVPSTLQDTTRNFRSTLAEQLVLVSTALLNGTLPWLPSFLSGFLQDNSDAKGVVVGFLALNDLWALSMTSTKNRLVLKDPLCEMSFDIMVQGRCVSYLSNWSGWCMAIIACVFDDNDGNRVYHMTFVTDDSHNLTETLFGYEVPYRISMSDANPDYPKYRMPKTRYGNIGSSTAENPHDMDEDDGYFHICSGLPFGCRSTALEICRLYNTGDLKQLDHYEYGSFPKFGTSETENAHQKAVMLLKKHRPGVPVNFPGGYPKEATEAMRMYSLACHYGTEFHANPHQVANTALNDIYRAMPDIPRPNVDNDASDEDW
jgi:hypothetical protein